MPPVLCTTENILFVAENLKNGGVAGLYRAFSEATNEVGWHHQLVDGQGKRDKILQALRSVNPQTTHGVVLGGISASMVSSELLHLQTLQIPVVGWHASAKPGPVPFLFTNISTDPTIVGQLAATYVMGDSQKGAVGIVIFNDNRFEVANAKVEAMVATIRQCRQCRILSVRNMPLDRVSEEIAPAVLALNRQFGRQWTHTLAINDVYFDEMNFPLLSAGRSDIRNVSAGDGAAIAIHRIQSGKSPQTATVAEPLGVQGWQLVDELNRAFNRAAPSHFIAPPILVTRQSPPPGSEIDAGIPFRSGYRKIWQATIH